MQREEPSINSRRMTRRIVGLIALALLCLILLLLVAFCDGGSSGRPVGSASQLPTTGPVPTVAPTSPPLAVSSKPGGPSASRTSSPHSSTRSVDPDIYKAKCREAAGELVSARVVYDRRLTMKLNETATVNAVVTFDKSLPPSQILPGHSNATAKAVGVTCQIQARLRGSTNEFDILPDDWESRALFENRTASWDWLVQPKAGGKTLLVIELRPVVRLVNQSDVNVIDPVFVTEPFYVDVTVETPIRKSIETGVDQTGKILQSVLAALVAAAGILGYLTRKKWWRGRSRNEDSSVDENGTIRARPATIIKDLRKMRVERGLDAGRIAKSLGISRSALNALEDGATVPTFRNVHDYADVLNVDVILRSRPGPGASEDEAARQKS
jgi:DNA-binding XRE family transcriptional regulator